MPEKIWVKVSGVEFTTYHNDWLALVSALKQNSESPK